MTWAAGGGAVKKRGGWVEEELGRRVVDSGWDSLSVVGDGRWRRTTTQEREELRKKRRAEQVKEGVHDNGDVLDKQGGEVNQNVQQMAEDRRGTTGDDEVSEDCKDDADRGDGGEEDGDDGDRMREDCKDDADRGHGGEEEGDSGDKMIEDCRDKLKEIKQGLQEVVQAKDAALARATSAQTRKDEPKMKQQEEPSSRAKGEREGPWRRRSPTARH
eukprot:TRINITY_DN33180_c0_g1_i1.p1 TRINITY_DN33180_c0_g1~~TRINITY_DN33180_c0_g1_i1.p1  ORF type:complete len:216 (+),score=88.73 TRINITY_DN33180_c0_g1_i1:91-738(+)